MRRISAYETVVTMKPFRMRQELGARGKSEYLNDHSRWHALTDCAAFVAAVFAFQGLRSQANHARPQRLALAWEDAAIKSATI